MTIDRAWLKWLVGQPTCLRCMHGSASCTCPCHRLPDLARGLLALL
jgi:hypothetical protein